MNYNFIEYTNTGLVRTKNEDAVGNLKKNEGHLMVLADGMGGERKGEVASKLTVEVCLDLFKNSSNTHPRDLLNKMLLKSNNAVYSLGKTKPEYEGMGTTLSILLIANSSKVFFTHVGDSRVYAYSNNKLSKLTDDHSFVQEMYNRSLIDTQELHNHPSKNRLLHAIGKKEKLDFDLKISSKDMQPGDIIFQCSDGWYNYIDELKVASILAENITLKEKVQSMLHIIKNNGSGDNVSIQIIKFSE